MKKIFLFAAATLSLTACNNDSEPTVPSGSDIAVITAQIGEIQSRAANTSWTVGDKIGITTTGNTKEYVNMEYTVDDLAAGTFTGNPIYFQKNGVNVTFTAYYPFAGTEGASTGIISNNTLAANQTEVNQPTIDYLWAQTTGSRTNHNINFTFAHKMSKLTLTFKNGNDTDVSHITSYTIADLLHKGNFNTLTGVTSATGFITDDLIMNVAGASDGKPLPSVILFPQTGVGDLPLSVVLDGETYRCVLHIPNSELIAGSNYNFTVKINKTGMNVVGSSITDWDDVDGGEIDAEM